MSQERLEGFEPRVQRALAELRGLIEQRYPGTAFEVSRGEDEPDQIHLTAVVDIEDTDEVLDLVIDRVVELQVEERIPVHVIPIRTPPRVLAAIKAEEALRRPSRIRAMLLLGKGGLLGR